MVDLKASGVVDFASLDLTYDSFRDLAQNPALDVHGKIGFPTAYREGYEQAILDDITRKLPVLVEGQGCTVVDVGPGCANLPKEVVELCRRRGHRIILVDSPEMLRHLPDAPGVTVKVPGAFPDVFDDVRAAAPAGADALICYSVFHYIFEEKPLVDFVGAVTALLADGGRALIGDIPNASKRRRFFMSPTGKRFHRAFTGRDEDPPAAAVAPATGKIDDAVLAQVMDLARERGCDAYLLPQPGSLPMANRRDDLLIARP